MNWKKQFIKFLKDNHLYESYIFNFNNDFKYRELFYLPNTGAKAFFENTMYQHYILRAFEWEKTLKGAHVWSLLDRKWYIYHHDIEKKLNEQQ